MARSITEIRDSILTSIASTPELGGVTSTSRYALYRLLAFVFATAAHALESLYDIFTFENNAYIAGQKPHRMSWYAEKAKGFLLGLVLVQDQAYYDVSSLTPDQVELKRVVKYSAVTKVPKGLRIKVATISGGDLAQLPNIQLVPLREYMEIVKDAGVKLDIDSLPPDKLKLDLTIYYDPLVLDSTGARLDGNGSQPVQLAIDAFLKSIQFNGLFVTAKLIDALQAVEGVVIPHLDSAMATYGLLPYSAFSVEYLPDSGYLRIYDPADLDLTFLPHEPI